MNLQMLTMALVTSQLAWTVAAYFLSANSSSVGNGGKNEKIVNGKDARIQEHPWISYIETWSKDKDGKVKNDGYCTGVFVHETLIVTAKHCLVDNDGKQSWSNNTVEYGYATFGSVDPGIKNNPNNNVKFTKYDIAWWKNTNPGLDFAMIRLQNPVKHPNFQPLPLPKIGSNIPNDGDSIILSGFGRTDTSASQKATVLQDLQMKAHSNCPVTTYYQEQTNKWGVFFCTGDWDLTIQGLCDGDSGGPVVCIENGRKVLCGINVFIDYTETQSKIRKSKCGHLTYLLKITYRPLLDLLYKEISNPGSSALLSRW